MNIQYKELEKNDARKLMNLRISVLNTDPYSFSITEDEETQASEEVVQSAIESYANSPNKIMLGAWMDKELVGVVGVERFENKIENHKARIWGPYVNKTSRGKGIGCYLIQKARDFSFSLRGIEIVSFDTSSESKSAISLFKKLGFQETGVLSRALKFDGKYADLLLMQMSKPT